MFGLATIQATEQIPRLWAVKGTIQFERIGAMEVDVHIARMSFEIDIENVNNHLAQLKQDLTKRKNMGHRVNKISKWQEELHRTVNQAAAQERRRKRNLLAWLASIGGLFNTMKIHQVKGTVDNVIDASTKVVHEVDVIQQHIMTQDKNVKLLAQELRTEQANTWDMSKRIEINLKWEEMERLITVLRNIIHALWTAQANEIQEWCHLTVRLPREMAFAINQTTAVWLVAKPTRITITCKRRTTMTKMMNTTTAIQLPKGCKAATEAFSFSPGEKESNTISTVARMVTDATNTTYEWNHKSWQLQRPQQIVRKGEEIRKMLDNARPPLIPVWVAVVLAIIALVAVLLFMGWLYITARRQWNLGTVVKKNERSEADEKDT